MEYRAVKGTRDFLPLQMQKRNYIFDTIKRVYKAHGFQPIETPAMESLSTLMGKYGDEGDKLLFKVLNSGTFLREEKNDEFFSALKDGRINHATNIISEKGLRYDLTVPFARFVVNHKEEITFPFKRYQLQPVWRADKPQKGRYREFYQCDADIIGSDSLMNEVELVEIIDEVFKSFSLKVTIKLNNRKILSAIAEMINRQDCLTQITVAIDKLDKIGMDGVEKELMDSGLTADEVEKIRPILLLSGTNEEKVIKLREIFSDSETGTKGLDELEYVLGKCKVLGIGCVEFDITLARGLNYYTGAILEVKANDVQMGSITGGGRYDNLTGIFGLDNMSGVGISFGADRIYDCLEEKNLFPEDITSATKVLFINFSDKESEICLPLAGQLRKQGINCEIYPDSAKLKKQMKYANDRHIPYVIMIGEKELQENKAVVKDMVSGTQTECPINEISALIK